MCKKDENNSFTSGLVIGAIAGTLLGLLAAPGPGQETRRKLKQKSAEYLAEGKEAYTTIRVESEPVVHDIQQKLSPLLAELSNMKGPLKEEALEYLNKYLSDLKKKTKNS